MFLRRTNVGTIALAPAKLNLCLELLGRRDDGRHELSTVMAAVGLFDTIAFETRPAAAGLSFRVHGPAASADVPAGRDNLVLRAVELLRRETGSDAGARIELVKRIPSQSGLGGGSADAAAALVAADDAWQTRLPIDRLAALGARLGSDVPFFVHAVHGGERAALCGGAGERITPLCAAGGAPCVVARGPAGLSTAEVYRATLPADFSDGGACDAVARRLAAGDWEAVARGAVNALENAAARASAGVFSLGGRLASATAKAWRMTGSGAAWFALCRSAGEAAQIAATLRVRGVAWAVATRTL